MEDPEIDPHSNQIFDKAGKTYAGENMASKTNVDECNEIHISHLEKKKKQLKWTNDFNVRIETLKMLKENTGKPFQHSSIIKAPTAPEILLHETNILLHYKIRKHQSEDSL